ncbi:MAG TPA: AAA family ATPase [Polyangia bacterium]|nr:AAA family ATPase [Polyangia bacterium]
MPSDQLKDCARCGFGNLPAARFCSGCGDPLVEAWPGDTFRERRWLSVLFCDIVGWSRLARDIGLEDASDLLDAYYEACAEVVLHQGGHFAQPLGDGVLVYFGYPTAHEDSAARALRASRELVEQVGGKALLARRPEAVVNIRVGVHTGWVVLIRGPHGEILARGDTTNVADRLQKLAEPNAVVTGEPTYRTTKGFFSFESLGPKALAGIAEPLHVYRVGPSTSARRRDEIAGGGLTPFIGREQEVATLLNGWQEAEKGRSRSIFITGEPGIGKSRQVRVLREHVEQKGHLVLECHCSPYHQGTALYPAIELIERNLGFTPGQSREAKAFQLSERMVRVGLGESTPIVAALLSLPTGDQFQPADLPLRKHLQLTFAVLVKWVAALAKDAPLLFVAEDLQWADASTIEFLGELMREGVPGVVTLLTARPPPHFVPPWKDLPRFSTLALDRLLTPEARALTTNVASGKALPPDLLNNIVRRAEGVPLFIEEMTKAVLDLGLEISHGTVKAPDTLNDWLMARLDRLGTAKAIIQRAAVLGRRFRSDVLRELVPADVADVEAELKRLVDSGLLFREGPRDDISYRFKHALIQEAAYESLLPTDRRQQHERIAQLLAAKSSDRVHGEPEILARHYAGAEKPAEAARYWRTAGEKAYAQSAFLEAISAFSAALEQLAKVPASPERDHVEAELQSSLGLALIQVKGWSVKEVEESYGRALELSRKYGDIPLHVHFGMWAVYVVRGDRDIIGELAPVFERVLDQSRDPSARFVAHGTLGARAFWTGDFAAADRHLNEAKTYCDRSRPKEQAQALLREYGYDGFLYPHVFMMWSDLYQGRERESVAGRDEALELARGTGNPYFSAVALGWAAALAHDMGDVEGASKIVPELMAVALDNGLYFWVAIAQSVGGWAAVQRGDIEAGLKSMNDGVTAHKYMGSRVVLPYYLSYVAEGCLTAGRIAEGLAAADEGLELARTNLATHFIPELKRIKGELLVAQGEREAAADLLQAALTLAKAQGAALFERRAAAALDKLSASAALRR